ncbi:MAG: universal stress protein [bacterium]|nr:universal stress protein [bacterium]
MPPRSILVAVDLEADGRRVTPGSQEAVREALHLSRVQNASVEILHSTFFHLSAEDDDSKLHAGAALPSDGRVALAGLVRTFCAEETPCILVLVHEHPVLAICRAATRSSPDWIVLGRHNAAEDSTRLGSICSELIKRLPTRIVIVTPPTDNRRPQTRAAKSSAS